MIRRPVELVAIGTVKLKSAPGDLEGHVRGSRLDRENLAGTIVRAVVEALESDAELARRLRALLGTDVAAASRPADFMTVAEYATHARISQKTIRAYIKTGMIEGEHFHREGRTGRRVIVHVREADLWRTARRPVSERDRPLIDFATDDILRRRAEVALKKARIPR